MSEQQVRYKGCDCMGTSSGPRIVMGQRLHTGRESIVTSATLVAFACDVCDAPWSDWMPAPSPGRGGEADR